MFTFAEVAPKTFAVQHTERAALALSGLLVFVTRLPAAARARRAASSASRTSCCRARACGQGPFVTEEEILTMADVAAEEAAIETEERELIHSIFEFGDTVVREVMVPRPDMVAVEADATVDEAIAHRDRRGQVAAAGVRRDDRQHRRARVPEGPRRRAAAAARATSRCSQMLRPRALRARVEARRRAAARDADREVPHGDRRRRVRRHRRPRHARGPARGDRRRDHRRVRRRGTAGRAAARTARCACPGARRSTRSTSCSTPTCPQDEWDTVGGLVFNTLGHVPSRASARASTGSSSAPSACRAAASCRCSSAR